jgi:Ni2+-binding GTPase involved in maturation of urease and hydrogenase
MQAARDDARRVNPDIEIIETSCVTSPGMTAWLQWLQARVDERAATGKSVG